ncbi:basic proline-rich protein-like [Hydractinia symbiolongicarpus]|uniref:basic proline-rich protein-like n=1 Tax=Hydractinia symbiolongicarpus TaxID=13093 RepID=UPI002551977C|nr:basic proline-rich protein-like [Hydractinia symbiolongicarpus]
MFPLYKAPLQSNFHSFYYFVNAPHSIRKGRYHLYILFLLCRQNDGQSVHVRERRRRRVNPPPLPPQPPPAAAPPQDAVPDAPPPPPPPGALPAAPAPQPQTVPAAPAPQPEAVPAAAQAPAPSPPEVVPAPPAPQLEAAPTAPVLQDAPEAIPAAAPAAPALPQPAAAEQFHVTQVDTLKDFQAWIERTPLWFKRYLDAREDRIHALRLVLRLRMFCED